MLSSARDRASEHTDFEEAARLHKQLEAVKSVVALRDDLVRDIAELNGVALTRASADRTLALWPMIAGSGSRPCFLTFPNTRRTRNLWTGRFTNVSCRMWLTQSRQKLCWITLLCCHAGITPAGVMDDGLASALLMI